jgi:hypothetical protein
MDYDSDGHCVGHGSLNQDIGKRHTDLRELLVHTQTNLDGFFDGFLFP